MNENVHLTFPNSLTLEKYHADHQLLQLLACPITNKRLFVVRSMTDKRLLD
jgi:hypothetical protein